MVESNLNTIIKNSINLLPKSRAFKIPDGRGGISIQSPMDSFGVLLGYPLYYETKLVKKNLNAFSFDRIEDHQYENLEFYHSSLVNKNYCLCIVGYYVPRVLKGVFIFDSHFVFEEHSKGIKSFKKKQLLEWKKDYFIDINYHTVDNKRVELLDLSSIESKIIKGYHG
jgi:hypothetical protein